MSTSVTAGAGGLVHPALFYGSDEEYLAGLVPFVVDGLALGEPVAVAVPDQRLRVLREGLGEAVDQVSMFDMTEVGRNPGRIIAGVLRRFADAHPRRPVRIVGEPIWPGRTDVEYPACVQHEALINAVFAGRNVTIVCPYDIAGLSSRAIDDALMTHPLVWEDGKRGPSHRYAPQAVHTFYNQPLNDAPQDGALVASTVNDILVARAYAVDKARELGLAAGQLLALELIASELVTNSLVHAKGSCRLRLWHHHDHLICEVSDTGRLDDPLAGRRPAQPGQLGGRGLLLVNDLADLVRVHTSPHGTTVRALLRLQNS